MTKLFKTQIRCTLQELYKCDGIEGFDDLVESKLDHGISNASFTITGTDNNNTVIIEITGELYETEGD